MRKIRKKVSFPDGKRHLFVYVLTDLNFFKFFLYLKKHWINADEQKQKDGITEGTHQKVPGGILLKKISETGTNQHSVRVKVVGSFTVKHTEKSCN